MASFFQPTSITGPESDVANSRFEYNWNATLKGHQLYLYWYQILVITVGCVALVVGCCNLIFQYARKHRLEEDRPSFLLRWKKALNPRHKTSRHYEAFPIPKKDEKIGPATEQPAPLSSPPKLSSIKTFCVSEQEIPIRGFQSNSDLHVVRLTGERATDSAPQLHLDTAINGALTATESVTSSSRRSTHESLLHGVMTHESVDRGSTAPSTMKDSVHPPPSVVQNRPPIRAPTIFYGALKPMVELSGQNASEKASFVNNLRLRQGLSGVVVSYGASDSAIVMNAFLQSLRDQHVSVILTGDPDIPVVNLIHLGLVDGFIIQNASVYPNGKRRDFFRAVALRECVARCKRQQKSRPEFFLGFLELWTTRPSAATLRRAFKLADFFGAVIQAQAVSQHNSRIDMCLSGFDWLKRPEIIKLQRLWQYGTTVLVSPESDSQATQLDAHRISEIIGPADSVFSLAPLTSDLLATQNAEVEVVPSPDYVTRAPERDNIWDKACCGVSLCELGCFNLRDQITQEHYNRILQTQRGLKELQMLHVCADIEILNISKTLKTILDRSPHSTLLQALIDQLADGQVRVYKGLDSGFTLPDDGGHMLGLSDYYQEDDQQRLDIYVSLKNSNDTATIWHVFLAHHGVSRLNRFEEELLFQTASGLEHGVRLPKSIKYELEQSTEAELLYLIEQIRLSDTDHPFNHAIIDLCTTLLLDEENRATWTTVHSRACLDNSLSIRQLLQMRLSYFAKRGARELPRIDKLVEFFGLLESKLEVALFNSDRYTLNQLSTPLVDAYNAHGPVDSRLDLYGLLYFCALRKLAFEDVFIETTDRCPLFLQQHDQAGVFAELWVLGSQCEIYFGILPRTLGEVIYDRYHRYLIENPPPSESWDGKDVFTAYSNTQARLKTEGHGVMTGSGSPVELPGQAPGYKLDEPESTKGLAEAASRFGALSIFCFPAVIDVLLLAYLGRGFYLTAFMNVHVVMMANYAILTALVMTGGITGWVGSTGGFYLFSFAFDNMAHFLVQRFSAAFMLTTVVAFCGFFAFGAQISWFAGFIFLIYLYALTTFLNLLGMFATIHRLGCPLTSGRTAMWRCIPILFISPILTTFVNGHDLLIYLLFIYTFIITLLITFRNLLHEWTTWLGKISTVKEKDVMTWYKSKINKDTSAAPVNDSPDVEAMARLALQQEVHKFGRRGLFRRIFNDEKDADAFVRKMAIGHPYALWLLEKEAGGSELPETYTTTWFVQLELAFANQRQLMRGLKEHSPFITFRYSKYDIGQNIGLFLGALLDRWIDITMSARLPQIVVYFDDRGRYGICFGLLYFLFGAVAVDVVTQRYWPYARLLPDQKIRGMDAYSDIKENETRLRNKRYRSALAELFTLLAIIFGVMTIVLWAFVINHRSIILYFTYVSGYTGVLLFQFHRCFTQHPKAHVVAVLVCCLIGFVVGCILRAVPSTAGFFYDYVIALNVTTISAAIVTFLLTGYFPLPFARNASTHADSAPNEADEEKHPAAEAKSGQTSWNTVFASHGDTVCNLTHKTHRKILQHLTLGIDANAQWSRIPEDVRSLIVCRLLGVSGRMTPETQAWLSSESKDLRSSDKSLVDSLNEYGSKRPTVMGADTALKVAGSYRVPDLNSSLGRKPLAVSKMNRICQTIGLTIYDVVKWTALISGAAPDASRELWFALRNTPLRSITLWILLKIWKLCWWIKNIWTYMFLILGKKSLSNLLNLKDHGSPRTLQGNTITVDTPLWKATGFITRGRDGNLDVAIFDGIHTEMPSSSELKGMAVYDSSYRLARYKDFPGDPKRRSVRVFQYLDKDWKRWATAQKMKAESGHETLSTYDKHGRMVSGKLFRGDVEFSFEYLYRKRPKGNTEILKATYTQESATGHPLSISVFWSVQPRAGSEKVKNWIPSDKIQRVVAVYEERTYEIKWVYKHARDPDLETTVTNKYGAIMPGLAVPASILEDEFGFLKKPQNLSFDQVDLLVYHPLRWLRRVPKHEASVPSPWMSKTLALLPFGYSDSKKKTIYRKLPTSVLRTYLWTFWGKPPFMDAVSACFLDEMILRKEPLLQQYWHLRDAGHLREAADVLDENLDQIISAIEPSTEASQTCPLLIKASDLFVMGLGKDANQVTARPEDAYHDTRSLTSVIFSDNGCWPDNPGGVSNCRRDLVNGHTTIRGHCLAESANDFGLPRYQIERNVNSLKILPLWGLDGKTPYHGILDNLLQTQVDERIKQTRIDEDIKGIFIPLLKSFVRGARMRRYARSDLITFSNVILQMNRYFEKCDFNKTWENQDVWNAWVEAWLFDYQDPNVSNPRNFFDVEQASLKDFRDALNLYICYFFIYSVELPPECPSVFQSTHHGISSLYGMLLKYRRGTTWGIWDHAILWRETCLNISPAQCLLPIPVQSMLLAGIKLACHLAYTHVDIVLPCTSVFNPDWEMDLGTDQGLRGSKKLFSRKIDAIVNGIGNMDAFKPVTETRSKIPTCVMLSNVQFIKDVKNAVLAADVIINKYGFDSYRLVVYGAQDRQPSYALETTTLINNRKLNGKVILAGFGSPKEVLKDAWLFMNSSLSEGLPLAIGEAALSGIPIVATEVGATALVLTDPDDSTKRYGEVVPPNDPEALARAQLSILSMLGPWAEFTKDTVKPPPLPDSFTGEDVKWITKRMYEKADDRRALGLKLRDVVLRSFHGTRYLREHEQMYWIQRSWAETRRSPYKLSRHPPANACFGEQNIFEYDDQADTGEDAKPRWQDFDLQRVDSKHQLDARKYSIGTYEKAVAG